MRKLIALDANLLVLLVVGLTKLEYIPMHRRLQQYSIDDFQLLKRAISESAGIVVTPNALSEASNLFRQVRDPAKTKLMLAFRFFVERTEELYIRSIDACSRSEFLRHGLADNALLEVAKNDVVMLSTDGSLCDDSNDAGYSAINFNVLRELQ